MSDIRISRLKLDEFIDNRPYFTSIVCGKRGSGKSTLMKDVLFNLHKRGVPRVVIFSATEEANSFYSSFVPPLFVYKGLDVKHLERIVEDQKKLTMRIKCGELPPETDISLVLLLDDVAYEKKTLNSPIMKELFYNGRHYRIILILSLQYLIDLSVGLRSNVDIGFFLKDNTKRNIEKVYDCFAGMVNTFSNFLNIYSACTNNFEAMAIDATSNQCEIEKNLFFYKADPNLEYRFGDEGLWKFNDAHFIDAVKAYQSQKEREREKRRPSEGKNVTLKV